MSKIAVWATQSVLPGQNAAAEEFFEYCREVADSEPGTTSFAVARIDERAYGIFTVFTDRAALDEHIAGPSGKEVVAARTGTIFEALPTITFCSLVTERTSAQGLPAPA